jgi:hypothetical protein
VQPPDQVGQGKFGIASLQQMDIVGQDQHRRPGTGQALDDASDVQRWTSVCSQGRTQAGP